MRRATGRPGEATDSDLLKRVTRTVERDDLLPAGCHALVAVSGGADSLAMLDLLLALGDSRRWCLTAAVFDHAWHDRSAEQVAATASWIRGRGLPLLTARAERPERSEAGARTQRHAFLRAAASAVGADRIALGHTADDRIETLLINLLRGTGSRGLAALPARAGELARPIVDLTRTETQAYADRHGLPVQHDPSNESGDNSRSILRRTVLPAIEAVRAGASEGLLRSATACAADQAALSQLGAELLDKISVQPGAPSFLWALPASCVDVRQLGLLSPAYRALALRAWLGGALGSLADVDQALLAQVERAALAGQGGAGLSWPRVFGSRTLAGSHRMLALAAWPACRAWGPRSLDHALPLPWAQVACEPAEPVLAARLRPADYQIRGRRKGDRYRPSGRRTKPVGEWLAEQGVPEPLRDAVPLVVVGGEIVWLPGQPPADGWLQDDGVSVGVVSSAPATANLGCIPNAKARSGEFGWDHS